MVISERVVFKLLDWIDEADKKTCKENKNAKFIGLGIPLKTLCLKTIFVHYCGWALEILPPGYKSIYMMYTLKLHSKRIAAPIPLERL